MEGNNLNTTPVTKQKSNMGIIVVLVLIIIGLTGFIVYKYVIEDKESNPSSGSNKTSKIEYNVSTGKLYVNGNESEIKNALEYNVKGQIEDVLIVAAGYLDGSTTYALDKDGKITFTFDGKGNIEREDGVIEGDSVIISSDNLQQDPQVAACNASDTDIVVYKEKFKYSNGKFDSSIISSETAQEYRSRNNITCTLTQETKIDLSKCLNDTASNYSNPKEGPSQPLGLVMNINSDKKSVALTIGWDVFGKLTGEFNGSEIKNYNITGFTKNVSNTFVGEVGQDVHGTKLVYIMEDGTVEYTSLFVKKTDNSGNSWYDMNFESQTFKTSGTISGVSDIVKLYNADGQNGRTVLAVKKDGSYYDIGKLMNN